MFIFLFYPFVIFSQFIFIKNNVRTMLIKSDPQIESSIYVKILCKYLEDLAYKDLQAFM